MTGKKESQSKRMVKYAIEQDVRLFIDQRKIPQIRIPSLDESYNEIHRLRSNRIRVWLAGLLWKKESVSPGSEAISSALNTLTSIAYDEAEISLWNRFAPGENGSIWIDLADEYWRAIHVTRNGWRIIEYPPLLFRRYKHQKSLPIPEEGGDILEILNFANLADREQEFLFMVSIISYYIPNIPHVVLITYGPQGSGKTFAMKAVRSLVDPSLMGTLTLPRNQRELVQQLDHHYFAPYDNISSMPTWISDILCRAVTGTGVSKRRLYTDEEDVIFQYHRCIGLTGINIAAQRGDLLERTILLGLLPIEKNKRLTEDELNQKLSSARPRIFAGILDILVKALNVYPTIKTPRLFRMADFTKWGCAIAEAMGIPAADFLNAYQKNIHEQYIEAIKANVVAEVLIAFMKTTREEVWEGTPTQLFGKLHETAEAMNVSTRQKAFPKNASALSRRINEIAPSLPSVGYNIVIQRAREGRKISINPVNPDTPVTGDDVDSIDGISRTFSKDMKLVHFLEKNGARVNNSPAIILKKGKENST